MFRIYFDTNVFSNLEGNCDEVYQKLNEALKLYKHNLSFFFSPAHIRDKRKADERKIDYFKFMETLVGDNHISYHALNKNTSHYLATPMMVYNDDEPELERFSLLEEKEDGILNPLLEVFKNTPVPIDTSNFKEIPQGQAELFSKMLPLEKENITIYDLMERFISFSREMQDDNKTYSELRNFIFKNFNQGKYDSKNQKIDFNEAFKDSQFQKTFVDYVKDSIHTKHEGEIMYYDFFLQSYTTLDILGISKDKIKSRNGFINISNDAQHSYYATYCDYLITEDKGLTEKSNTLCTLYGVHTKVLSVVELLSILPRIGADTENDISHFVSKFQHDTIEGEKLESRTDEDGTIAIPIEISDRYLNFFDKLEQFILPSGELYFIFTREGGHHYLDNPNYREQEILINKAVHLFGPDINQLGYFDFEKEKEEINSDTWKGRLWKFGSLLFYLHKNNRSDKICLQIGPFSLSNSDVPL